MAISNIKYTVDLLKQGGTVDKVKKLVKTLDALSVLSGELTLVISQKHEYIGEIDISQEEIKELVEKKILKESKKLKDQLEQYAIEIENLVNNG